MPIINKRLAFVTLSPTGPSKLMDFHVEEHRLDGSTL